MKTKFFKNLFKRKEKSQAPKSNEIQAQLIAGDRLVRPVPPVKQEQSAEPLPAKTIFQQPAKPIIKPAEKKPDESIYSKYVKELNESAENVKLFKLLKK